MRNVRSFIIQLVSGMIIVAAIAMFVVSLNGCSMLNNVPTANTITKDAQKANMESAAVAVDIPILTNFMEKKTIAEWFKRWDKPDSVAYVYLYNSGQCIGYYVTRGKPSSTRSYLTPETQMIRADLGEAYGDMMVEAPDADGTYGENNPGIRFFTAEGTAVEWGGSGATYLYADAPIKALRVPKLNVGDGNE